MPDPLNPADSMVYTVKPLETFSGSLSRKNELRQEDCEAFNIRVSEEEYILFGSYMYDLCSANLRYSVCLDLFPNLPDSFTSTFIPDVESERPCDLHNISSVQAVILGLRNSLSHGSKLLTQMQKSNSRVTSTSDLYVICQHHLKKVPVSSLKSGVVQENVQTVSNFED